METYNRELIQQLCDGYLADAGPSNFDELCEENGVDPAIARLFVESFVNYLLAYSV